MRALDRKLWRDLRRIRGQVLAIVMVIASGTALTVMSLDTVRSLEAARTTYYERERFADIFARVVRAPEPLRERIAALPGIKAVETRIVADVTLDMDGVPEPVTGRLVSVPENGEPRLNTLRLMRGRAVGMGRSDEVVVGEAFARAHALEPGDRLVATISGRRRVLDIVGVALSPEYLLSAGGGSVADDRLFGVLWMGRKALAAAYDLDGAFNDVTATLLRGASEADVVARLDRLLAPFGGTGAHGREDQISYAALSGELDQLRAISRLGMPVFLGVVVFLLNIVLARIVDTEREQIGLLKAFGYTNAAVAGHYLKLVLAVAGLGIVLGGFGGVWLGQGLTGMYGRYYHFPSLGFDLTASTVAVAAGAHLAAAVLGPLGSLRRVARLPPAVAMAPPMPTAYRRSLAERLGLSARVDVPTRMILRHLARWPVRAGLTSLGMAAAVAILVGLLSIYDAVDRVVEFAFFRTQRQDVAVTFVEPEPFGAVAGLRRMPGVLRVEPFRAVAARIRFGHHAARVQLLGLDPGGDLNRVLDPRDRPVRLPAEGIVVSRKLMERFGARPGDRLHLDMLEGRRPTPVLPVVAMAQDYLGLTASLSLTTLNRLMGEGRVVSGAWLRVDPAREDDLLAALKRTPAVAQVRQRRAELATLERNLGESTRLVYFYVLFAGVVAFGVVYNRARIALSERGRELASLRVLGFTRFEVSYVLLGELAVLAVAALPLGCLLGYGVAALLATAFDGDQFRLPLVIDTSTYGSACLVVLAAAAISAILVRRRIERLDLVAVLKTRE